MMRFPTSDMGRRVLDVVKNLVTVSQNEKIAELGPLIIVFVFFCTFLPLGCLLLGR